jgi:type I restriction enzyme S subunit
VLTERQEQPSQDDLVLGRVKIVEKIRFKSGQIQLRANGETKTGMILARPGDLVVSGINAAKGAIAVYGEENTEPIAATIHYGAYVPNRERVSVDFLWWLLRSRIFKDLLQEYVPGGIKTELKAKRFLPVPIPLPPLTEQQRIVARIEALAGQIREAHQLRQRASEEAEALHYSVMKKMRLELGNSAYPKAKLGGLTKVSSGGTPSRDNQAYWGGGIPWIKTGELLDRDIIGSEEHITELGVANSSAKIFPPDTILIALYGQGQTRGRTGRLTLPATTNQACCAVLPNLDVLEPRFVQLWLRSLYHDLREEAQGGAQPNWNGSMIKNLEIAVPSIEEQRRIVAELDALQTQVGALKHAQAETAAELDALLPAILAKAFRGEL